MKKHSINKEILTMIQEAHQRYPVTQHPLIQGIKELTFSVDEIHRIAKNIYHVVKHFPRFLSAITTNMEDTIARMPLVENLFEEHGRMKKKHIHLNSYIEFLKRIGVDPSSLESFEPCPGVTAYIRSIIDLCLHYPYLEGLASLGMIEDIVHQVSPIIGQVTTRKLGGNRKVEHFSEHEVIDEQHSEEIFELLQFNNPQEKETIHKGLFFGAYAHYRLYTDILEAVTGQVPLSSDTSLEIPANIQSHTKTLTGEYLLTQGEGGLKRLAILNRLYNLSSIEIIKRHIQPNTQRILEIGCGAGDLVKIISKEISSNIELEAIDISPALIEIAQKDENFNNRVHFQVASMQEPEKIPGLFDLIYLRWVLIYQPSVEELLKQWQKKLKPGGYFIIEDNNPSDSGCFSHEYPSIIKQWEISWQMMLAHQKPQLEKTLLETAQRLGMKVHMKGINQQTLNTREEKEVFLMGALEYIENAKINREEVAPLLEKLTLLSQSQYPIDFVKNFQIVLENGEDNPL